MNLTYVVGAAGWATAAIACGDARIEMPVSYLQDSLRDLLSAANAISSGAREITVVFMDEPGEHHLHVRRIDDERIILSAIWFSDWTSRDEGGSAGTRVLSCESTVAHFRGQVLAAARAILDEHGLEGYRELWREYEFPLEQYEQLRKTRKRNQA